jgi:glutamate racemase
MRILITDSGVGGVSVVAYAERFVRTHGFTEPVQLTFANAAPANDYGYNSMPSREAKIETFDRFLRNVTERYSPDMIYIACNTLSVLFPFMKGIVETGVALLLRELQRDPRSVAMIFATQTTTDSGTYPRHLQERGIDASRIVTQACPGLADIISEDREGTKARAEIEKWVAIAMEKLPSRDLPIVACLACTHYGYRKELFAAALCHPERSEGPGWSGGTSIAPPARPGPSLTLGMTGRETVPIGLAISINRTFFVRRHALICFSRAIASVTSVYSSKWTSRVTLYCAVKQRGLAKLRCQASRVSRSPVTPV